jgi:hypothetical protein
MTTTGRNFRVTYTLTARNGAKVRSKLTGMTRHTMFVDHRRTERGVKAAVARFIPYPNVAIEFVEVVELPRAQYEREVKWQDEAAIDMINATAPKGGR